MAHSTLAQVYRCSFFYNQPRRVTFHVPDGETLTARASEAVSGVVSRELTVTLDNEDGFVLMASNGEEFGEALLEHIGSGHPSV
jgi:hypothetical protein